MSDLLDKYPVINKVKVELRRNKEVSTDQIKDYSRRCERSPFLMAHVELLQKFCDRVESNNRLFKKAKAERDEYKTHLNAYASNYNRAKKNIIKEFGEKSYEYQVAFETKYTS
jgi:hypothetical protein